MRIVNFNTGKAIAQKAERIIRSVDRVSNRDFEHLVDDLVSTAAKQGPEGLRQAQKHLQRIALSVYKDNLVQYGLQSGPGHH